jgi:hypothetical protein
MHAWRSGACREYVLRLESNHGEEVKPMSRIGKVILAFGLVFLVAPMALAHTFSVDNLSVTALAYGLHGGDVLQPGAGVAHPVVNVPYTNIGLKAKDDLDALSGGQDIYGSVLFFSVDRASVGVAGGAVTPLESEVSVEAANKQAAGDVFVTVYHGAQGSPWPWSNPQGYNRLHINQAELGLFPTSKFPTQNNDCTTTIDNLDAISFSEFDLTGDGVTDVPLYFSLAKGSPSLVGGKKACDILMVPAGLTAFQTFADGVTKIGLLAGDDVDAMVLQDIVHPGVLDNGIDKMMFSLAPGSPTLAGTNPNLPGVHSAADIFGTLFDGNFGVMYTADQLGLQFGDNVDALEIQGSIPEPGTLFLLGTGVIVTLGIIRRRRMR